MTIFKKYFFLVIILLSLMCQNIIAKEVGDVYVFLVDQSGSMKQDNLSKRVKVELQKFIKDEIALNDRLLIMGFGDRNKLYYNGIISKMEEKESAYNVVSKLKSNHNWTHMSSAFNQLANRLNELNVLYPRSSKYIYVFTDGKNDPPPNLNEEPALFQYILGKQFGMNKLKKLKSYIYYISFGIKAPDEIVEIEKKSENFKVTESPRKGKEDSRSIIPVEIELKLKDDSFKINKNKRKIIELKFKVLSISRASDIKIKFDNKEKIIPLNKRNKKFEIEFSPNKLSEGDHKMLINISSMEKDGKVRPNKYKIAYKVIIPDYTFLYIAVVVLIIIIIIVIIYQMRPSFNRARLIFSMGDNEFPKRLRGKSCKKLSDLQRGWGIPVSLKVCPDSIKSRIKLKFKITKKQSIKLTKNGLELKKSPEVLRTGESIEFGNVKIKFDNN